MAITDSLNPVEYDDVFQYAMSCGSAIERIRRIEDIIDQLIIQQGKLALNANVEEYKFNNGQSVVHTVYRKSADIDGIIHTLNKLKSKYERKCRGNMFIAQTSIPKY